MSFLENSLILHRLQSEINRNKEEMLKERCEITKIKEQNKFLMGVQEDYNRYYNKMAEGKNKYKKQLEKLSTYLENQIEKAGLSENELRQAKFEQKNILKDLDKVKLDIDQMINTSEEIIN
jgi:hypothetical protein